MRHDVVIIGAGPSGLALARAIAETNLNVILLEKHPESILADPPYDGREVALTHSTKRFMKDLDIWDRIATDQISLIKEAKVLNGKSSYALCFDSKKSKQECLGFMVSNHIIKKAMYESLAKYKNIEILSEVKVSKIHTDREKGCVEFTDGRHLEASLIVAADSRFSTTRGMMGIPTSLLDFGRTCVVCTMKIEKPHNNTAYECFHFDRTLAVLPLNHNRVSIVITLKSEENKNVLELSNEDFSAEIVRRLEGRFGAMKLTSKLFSYPLVASLSKTFYSNKFAIIGDAAVGMHPVTAHGFNLGLRGVRTLANEIKTALQLGGDFSSKTVLERYSRKHHQTCAPLYHSTNALVFMYTRMSPPARFVRHALLRLGNHIGPAKRFILNMLTETKDGSY